MTVAAVLAFGCVAHAASFTWGFSSDSIIKPGGGSDDYLEGGTAFLYLGTVTASETAFNLSSAKYLASAGQSDSYKFGVFDSSNPATSGNLEVMDAGQAYTLILVEKSDIETLVGYEGNYIIADGTSVQGVDPESGTAWGGGFVNRTAYSGDQWSSMTASVPEPTSGLLILIGMAGLALKRKRA